MVSVSRRAIIGAAASATFSAAAYAEEQRFAVAQEWRVRDLPDASAVIGRIDDFGGVRIIHIVLLVGAMVEFGEPENSGSMQDHLAVTEQAFMASIGDLIEEDAHLPGAFEGGYARWRSSEMHVLDGPVSQYVRRLRSASTT
jgi:hypothetical protein